ncbi:MAG: hypothetical protein K0B01_14750 [Syntrophobacterales bacterium]|nr:hypothetical protein [Syntrophobacterales bacterium]
MAKSSSTVHGKQKTELLNCNIKGLTATGYLTPNGIVVPKDSQAVLEERASAQKWPSVLVQRNKLIEDGALIEKDGAYAFVRDIQIADGLESARG